MFETAILFIIFKRKDTEKPFLFPKKLFYLLFLIYFNLSFISSSNLFKIFSLLSQR